MNDLLARLGFARPPWLTSPALAFDGRLRRRSSGRPRSFVALVILAGLQTIPPLALRGRHRRRRARRLPALPRVTLPLLRPALVVALIFRTDHRRPDLRHPLRHDARRPRRTTETLAMYIHTDHARLPRLGYGAALAVVMFLLSMRGDRPGYLRRQRGHRRVTASRVWPHGSRRSSSSSSTASSRRSGSCSPRSRPRPS